MFCNRFYYWYVESRTQTEPGSGRVKALKPKGDARRLHRRWASCCYYISTLRFFPFDAFISYSFYPLSRFVLPPPADPIPAQRRGNPLVWWPVQMGKMKRGGGSGDIRLTAGTALPMHLFPIYPIGYSPQSACVFSLSFS